MKTKKLIELARHCVDSDYTDCHGCQYEAYPACLDMLITDLADMLEELHEKSKAKRVVEPTGYCPSCDIVVDRDMKYCPYCGQKLKWEEADDESH